MQKWHIYYLDKKRWEVSNEVDQQVLVKTANIKLKSHVLESYGIITMDWPILDTEEDSGHSIMCGSAKHIEDLCVFHVSLTRSYTTDVMVQTPPPPIY